MRFGKANEPVELRPGIDVRKEAERIEVEQWAWRRMYAIRAFYTHLTIYAVVNFLLVVIDLATPGGPWFFYALVGWGLGLGLHAAQTFERLPWFSRDWEDAKVADLIEKRMNNEP